MRISTKAQPTGRYIVRANKPTGPMTWGYALQDMTTPTLSMSIEGQDGKSYSLNLTDEDISSINAARERHAEAFDNANRRTSHNVP